MLKSRKAQSSGGRPRGKCKYCGLPGHTQSQCFSKPRKPIDKESAKTRRNREVTARKWFAIYPPDEYGHWECYLQISPYCPRVLTRATINLEHVYPKGKYKALRYIPENIKPSCRYCNQVKLSNTVSKLMLFYPRLRLMVATPEWQEWEDQMETVADQLGLQLDRPGLGPRRVTDLQSQ